MLHYMLESDSLLLAPLLRDASGYMLVATCTMLGSAVSTNPIPHWKRCPWELRSLAALYKDLTAKVCAAEKP